MHPLFQPSINRISDQDIAQQYSKYERRQPAVERTLQNVRASRESVWYINRTYVTANVTVFPTVSH